MLSGSKNPTLAKTNKVKLIFFSKYAVCDSKKLRFIKEQEAIGLLNNLRLKASLSKISLLGDTDEWSNKQFFISKR